MDYIHWPPRALGVRHVLGAPLRPIWARVQPNPPASRTLVAPGLPRRDVLAPPPVTTTSLHPELSSGDGDFALLACIVAVFAILVFWMKKARAKVAAPQDPKVPVLPGALVTPKVSTTARVDARTPASPPGLPTLAHLFRQDQPPICDSRPLLAHAREQLLIPSIRRIPTLFASSERPPRLAQESQRQGSAAWSIQVCIAPTVSASAAPLPIDHGQVSCHAKQQSAHPAGPPPTRLSLPDQPPPQTQRRHQKPDNPSHLARLHAVPLGSDHPGFDYKDLDWRSFLGAGAFGTVYKAVVRHTKREITVKCVRHWTERGYERILDELALARVLGQSPWYAELYGAFCTWDRVFIAMEFHSGGTLLDYIWNQGGRLHPCAARFYAAELLVAVSHAHALGIMHRDIKPDNILLDKTGHIVIIDMGIAVRFGAGDDAWTSGAYGTEGFMAPEVAQGLRYDARVDCFAWGVTLYYMLTGTFPTRLSQDSKGRPIGAGGLSYYDINNDAHTGYWERDLLAQVLAHRIQDRPTFSQMKSHPYWVGIDWAKVEQRLANPPPARGAGCPRLERRLRTRRQTMA